MVDCGDLEKLPPEIRNEIYALALVQAEPFALCNFSNDQDHLGGPSSRGRRAPKMKNKWARTDKPKVAPVGHHRNPKGRGHKYVINKWVEVPSNVALLCVNKKICKEAAPVLYGRTKFRFKHANTMRRFVDSIGDNIRYLRDVGIPRGGWEWRYGYVQARHAIEALAAAKSMHTFEVSHGDVCPKASAKYPKNYPGTHKVVEICRPLFNSLKVAFKNNNVKASILEVVKIGPVEPSDLWTCRCTMEEATKAKVELQRGIQRSIAEQHELEFESRKGLQRYEGLNEKGRLGVSTAPLPTLSQLLRIHCVTRLVIKVQGDVTALITILSIPRPKSNAARYRMFC